MLRSAKTYPLVFQSHFPSVPAIKAGHHNSSPAPTKQPSPDSVKASKNRAGMEEKEEELKAFQQGAASGEKGGDWGKKEDKVVD